MCRKQRCNGGRTPRANVVVDGCPVECVSSFRYLGLTVDRCKGFGTAPAAVASAALQAACGLMGRVRDREVNQIWLRVSLSSDTLCGYNLQQLRSTFQAGQTLLGTRSGSAQHPMIRQDSPRQPKSVTVHPPRGPQMSPMPPRLVSVTTADPSCHLPPRGGHKHSAGISITCAYTSPIVVLWCAVCTCRDTCVVMRMK